MNKIEYKVIDGIKIYTGTTVDSRERYKENIKYLKSILPNGVKIFSVPEPSTLTAQGLLSNISFDECEIIDMLPNPTGDILMIGCNFGEKYNADYVIPVAERKSGRGRKPKPKEKTKRRIQGNGKYFGSQITFLIRNPDNECNYKIKLFRTGVFQAPGVKNPDMSDLVLPIRTLVGYLAKAFGEDVQVLNFIAVMRNYKSKLLDNKFVDLIELENKINDLKSYRTFEPYLRYELRHLSEICMNKALRFIGKSNPLNIAEVTYNTDKCFCLNIKFYRPMHNDSSKKTTVKLLKKGKINFDGGNSELEMLELYHWLEYIYSVNQTNILVSSKIDNVYDMTKMTPAMISRLEYSDVEQEDSTCDPVVELRSETEQKTDETQKPKRGRPKKSN